jgi:hypothetical protein
MTTTPNPEAKPARLWQSRMGESPAEYAALFAEAAKFIRTCGYDPYHEHGPAIGVADALRMAARDRAAAEIDRSAMDPERYRRALEVGTRDWAEELEHQFSAVLYVVGQKLYSHDRHLSEALPSWEFHYSSDAPKPNQAAAIAMLETASVIYALLAGSEHTNGQ